MDFEIEKNKVRHFEPVLDTRTVRDESAEIIVPDQFPDIMRVVDASGLVCLKEKSCRDGKIDVSGTVRVNVLYAPEGARGLRKLETTVPYQASFECPDLTSESEACVNVCIHSIEPRMVNSRKVHIRIGLAVSAKVFSPTEYELSCGVADASDVETLKSSVQAYLPVAVKSKNFSIIDDIEIASSKAPAAELLRVDIRLAPGDARAIGNKVVFKGSALIKILYRSNGADDSDEIYTTENELPFSQILEMEGLDEDSDCTIMLSLCGAEMDIHGSGQGQSHTIGVTLNLNATGVAWMNRTLETLSDAYSTTCEIESESRPLLMKNLVEKSTRRQTVREVIETGIQAGAVLDVSVLLEPPALKGEGDRNVLSANAIVSVVFLGEDGSAYNSSRNIPVVCPVDLPEGAGCEATATFAGDAFGAGAANGVEVRFSADFDVSVTKSQRINSIISLKGEPPSETETRRPSVVLRHTVPGEKLWDIAKSYRTTVSEVMSANGLEDMEQVMDGRLLLISRKR